MKFLWKKKHVISGFCELNQRSCHSPDLSVYCFRLDSVFLRIIFIIGNTYFCPLLCKLPEKPGMGGDVPHKKQNPGIVEALQRNVIYIIYIYIYICIHAPINIYN